MDRVASSHRKGQSSIPGHIEFFQVLLFVVEQNMNTKNTHHTTLLSCNPLPSLAVHQLDPWGQ